MNPTDLTSVKATLAHAGWCLFRDAENNANLLSVASEFGTPVTQKGCQIIGTLKPHFATTARPNSTSSIYGLGAFPLHTDMAHWPLPPRYLVMRAKVASCDVPTLLVDHLKLEFNEKYRALLPRASWKVLKVNEPFLCSMFFEHKGVRGIRWDVSTMSPNGKIATEINAEILRTLQNLMETSSTSIYWNSPDDILVIDNWRMLHARPPVPEHALARTLERILLMEKNID